MADFEVDPVEYGKLVQAVTILSGSVEKLTADVQELNKKLAKGTGVGLGLMLAAGGLGATVVKILEALPWR